jgi:hypothetical protein
VKQDLKKPSFFLSIIPINFGLENSFQRNKSLLVDLAYTPMDRTSSETVQSELRNMVDSLQSNFPPTLTVSNEVLILPEFNIQIVDEVLHITSTISYLANMETPIGEIGEDRDYMQNLNLRSE